MSHISIRRHHSLGIRGARAAAQRVADELAEEYGVDSEWEGDVLSFERPGVTGSLAVSAREIAINLRLGLLLLPFRNQIEARISENLDDIIG